MQKEFKTFSEKQEQQSREICAFEDLLSEYGAHSDRALLELQARVEKQLQDQRTQFEDLQFTNVQVKTMLRNHNHHFTELQKQQGVHKDKLAKLLTVTEGLPELKTAFAETELYLQKYLPCQMLAQQIRILQWSMQ